MRKIITTTFVTLDGVMQAPGGPTEDTSGGFKYGGWSANYWDEMMGSVMDGFMALPFELLLGKKTYDIFAAFWSFTTEEPEVAEPFNATRKYVVSEKPFEPSWHNSTVLNGDVVAQIFPVTVGSGKRLFAEGTQAEGFKLIDSKIATTGVIIATYEPAGTLRTGSVSKVEPDAGNNRGR